MVTFSKDSLELLRHRIDLVEVLSPYVDFKKAGSSYKALCPFHDEKSPSFVIKKGDSHYHCFGCSAHGDAIAFLMDYAKMSFLEAVESLAEKFSVPLEKTEYEKKGPSKTKLKEVLVRRTSTPLNISNQFCYNSVQIQGPQRRHLLQILYISLLPEL